MEEPISGLRTAGKKVINLRCELVTKNGRYVYEENQRQQVIDLSSKTDQRNTVIVRRRKTSYQVRGPRSAGYKTHSHLTSASRVSIRLMHQYRSA